MRGGLVGFGGRGGLFGFGRGRCLVGLGRGVLLLLRLRLGRLLIRWLLGRRRLDCRQLGQELLALLQLKKEFINFPALKIAAHLSGAFVAALAGEAVLLAAGFGLVRKLLGARVSVLLLVDELEQIFPVLERVTLGLQVEIVVPVLKN